MLGFGQPKPSADGDQQTSRLSWFAAVGFTVVTVASIFYLVAAASGARLDRILDQGSYSDLQRIGREIDRRINNLAIENRGIQRESENVTIDRKACDGDAEVCVEVTPEEARIELNEPATQACNSRFIAPQNFGASFGGICERDVAAKRGQLALYFQNCPLGLNCSVGFEPAGFASLKLNELGLERLSNYAFYDERGELAAQIDGTSIMPARLPLHTLQHLASEAFIEPTSAEQNDTTGRTKKSEHEKSDETNPLNSMIERETTIAGQKFKVYAIRFDNSQPMMVGAKTCAQRQCYIVGLAPVRGLWDDLTSLSPMTQLVFIAIIGILILSIQILKMATVAGSSAFGRVDVGMLALSIPLAAATATLVLSAYANWYHIAGQATQNIARASEQIDELITDKISNAFNDQQRSFWDRYAAPKAAEFVVTGEKSGKAQSVTSLSDGFTAPPRIIDRDYVKSLLRDEDLWSCPEGAIADRFAFEIKNDGKLVRAGSSNSQKCRIIVARQRSLAGGSVVDRGLKSTVIGVPASLTDKRNPQLEEPVAALITALSGPDGKATDLRLAEAAHGFGYAVIDSRNSQVQFHQKSKRELVEYFSQEMDRYAGGWLDRLATSMREQCLLGSGELSQTSAQNMFYDGRLRKVVAKPNCQTGWITLAWWDVDELQYQATEAAVLAAAIYLTFAVIFLLFLFVAINCGWFDPRALWPDPDNAEKETARARRFVIQAVLWLIAGVSLFVAAFTSSGSILLSNLILWLTIALIWERYRSIMRRPRGEKHIPEPGEKISFDAHQTFRRWQVIAKMVLVMALAIVPMVTAYVSADQYRDSLRHWIDGGLEAQAARAAEPELQPAALILSESVLMQEAGPQKELRCFQKRKSWVSLLGDPLMPRVSQRHFLTQTSTANHIALKAAPKEDCTGEGAATGGEETQAQPSAQSNVTYAKPDTNPPRQWTDITKFVGLGFLAIILALALYHILRGVQRALFGLHHVQLPARDTDTDILKFIAVSREGGTRKFLIIDCDDDPRSALEEDRQKAQEIVRLDLALERHTLEHLEAPDFQRRIWFITNVDVVLSDPDIRDRGLKLLETLASRPEAEVYLFSEVPPLVRLRTEWEALVRRMELMGDDTKAAGEMLYDFEVEQSRWSRLLGDFQTIYCSAPYAISAPNSPNRVEIRDKDSDQVKRVKEEARNIRYREAKAQLARLSKERDKLEGWSEEQVTTRIQAEMAEYYERQWRICSRAEQLALLQLAEGKFLNNANITVIGQLMQRGLIVRDPEFRIMNKSFAHWVLNTEKGRSFDRFRMQAESGGAWQLLRLPLLIAVIGSVSLFGYLNQENIEFMVALLPALLSGVPILISTLFGSKTPVAR